MPTVYTALRAKHRHKIIPPDPSLPAKQVFAAPPGKTLLAAEKDTQRPGPGLGLEVERSMPSRKIAIIGAGLAGLCAAYELVVWDMRSRFLRRATGLGVGCTVCTISSKRKSLRAGVN
jgi:hypothetical protein